MTNPFLEFTAGRTAHFLEESKRLRSKAPLQEYKVLLDVFDLIFTKLGTVEHEVALAQVSKEFQAVSKEASEVRRSAWRNFQINRREEKVWAAERTAEAKESAELLAEIERAAKEAMDGEISPDMRAALDETVAAARQAHTATLPYGEEMGGTAWLLLRINLQSYGLYMRYHWARTQFFLVRHGFIFLTSILVFGIAYSQLAKEVISRLVALAPAWPWAVAVLTVLAAMAKKYLIDPRLKKLQVKLETRRLRPLAFQMHIARSLALAMRIARRGAADGRAV
ncbi:hypothetical protein SNE35_29890 [Paucibacter sp. R3-3]|uniref:Uncharacterized protein n=1 Tax=Roseateles agri TaxID=3098619 RepID=A0ABU5DQZ5_9BURK|nr:hypothetical protein [Paucibacter sp. R3-3]MDY0748748.1 hypothetical protein [Paucibacter sp. R3-3]